MRPPGWLLYIPAVSLFFGVAAGDLHPIVLLEGAVAGLLTTPMVWRLLDLSRRIDLGLLLRGTLRFCWTFTTLFIPQAFVSSIDMARRVVSPVIPMCPGVVAIPIDFEGPLDALLFQNHLTLTPGAMVVEYDQPTGVLYLHTIDATDPEKVRRDVQETYRRARGGSRRS